MKLSVILTTYNQPEWLEKVLWGYATQDVAPDELLIADDGSDERTRSVVGRMRGVVGCAVEHVWHEDDGFRKCQILNRAIEAATGDYLLFSDGDCVPRADFVGHHRRLAKPGRFLSGGYLKLSMPLSEAITPDDIRDGRLFDPTWLRANGLGRSRRVLRLATRGFAAATLDAFTPTRPTWNGNNASGWADDLRRAGGFDERMRYGGLDRELGERLENAGVRGLQVRNRAVCLHLDHPRGYANAADWARNDAIRRETRLLRKTTTDFGLHRAA